MKKEKKSRLDKLMRFHPEMAERVSYMDVYYLSISLNEIIEESWNKMQERVGNGIFCKKQPPTQSLGAYYGDQKLF